TELSVTLSDGRVIGKDRVKVLGTDDKTDLAVVKVDAERLIPAKWGDSDSLERGDFVCAFGSPFGHVGSMTHGIVSALNRQAGIAKTFGFSGDKGVLVQETFSNTPATGKLRRGDIITEIAGKPVDNMAQLRNQVAATPPGKELNFKVWRDNKYQDVAIKIGE